LVPNEKNDERCSELCDRLLEKSKLRSFAANTKRFMVVGNDARLEFDDFLRSRGYVTTIMCGAQYIEGSYAYCQANDMAIPFVIKNKGGGSRKKKKYNDDDDFDGVATARVVEEQKVTHSNNTNIPRTTKSMGGDDETKNEIMIQTIPRKNKQQQQQQRTSTTAQHETTDEIQTEKLEEAKGAKGKTTPRKKKRNKENDADFDGEEEKVTSNSSIPRKGGDETKEMIQTIPRKNKQQRTSITTAHETTDEKKELGGARVEENVTPNSIPGTKKQGGDETEEMIQTIPRKNKQQRTTVHETTGEKKQLEHSSNAKTRNKRKRKNPKERKFRFDLVVESEEELSPEQEELARLCVANNPRLRNLSLEWEYVRKHASPRLTALFGYSMNGRHDDDDDDDEVQL